MPATLERPVSVSAETCPMPPRGIGYPPALKASVFDLRAKFGYTPEVIAKKLKLSKSTVHRWLYERGLVGRKAQAAAAADAAASEKPAGPGRETLMDRYLATKTGTAEARAILATAKVADAADVAIAEESDDEQEDDF